MLHSAIFALALAAIPLDKTIGCTDEGTFNAANGEAHLAAQVEGKGPIVVMIPSLGRGPNDFNDLSSELVQAGYRVIRFEPRWFGRSDGPKDANLFDLADDVIAVVDATCPGSRFTVVGHAFGNRVARAVATQVPERATSVILLAAGGKTPVNPEIADAIAKSASEGIVPDDERLKALRLAFFAPRSDASRWLTGWSPKAAELQGLATRATDRSSWWAGGKAPILVVQPDLDPVAPIANAMALQQEFGDRITVVMLPQASHAMLPEQPAAISTVVQLWLGGERSAAVLDQAVKIRVFTR